MPPRPRELGESDTPRSAGAGLAAARRGGGRARGSSSRSRNRRHCAPATSPHLLTTLPAPAGGGRCVRHAAAATGRRRRRGTGAARGRSGRAAKGWRRRSWVRLVEPGVERGRPSACPTAKPAAARPTAFSTVLPPRASCDDLQAEALGRTACRARRAASRHRRSRHGAERRVGGHWSRLRGQSVRLPPLRGPPVFAERRRGVVEEHREQMDPATLATCWQPPATGHLG